MNEHTETALDQLRNADDLVVTPEDEMRVFLAAAQVHATLALAAALAGPARPATPSRLVTGAAGVPIDCYDAIELLADGDHPARLLSAAARRVADLWNDPDEHLAERIRLEHEWPALADALHELLGGGPTTPPTTWADVRPAADAAGPLVPVVR